MLDHVSLGVRDLARSAALYEEVLGTLGHAKLMEREGTVGFGKKYPELWLNLRAKRVPQPGSGDHVCLRARTRQHVEAFYRVALEAGARGEGAPGFRPEYHPSYYAAFIRDFDGHLVEVVTFVDLG